MVPAAHTVVVCVVRGWGGGGTGKHGVLKLFSSSFLGEIEPHRDSVYAHSGCCSYAQSSSVWPQSGYVCCFIARSLCMLL